jgi:ATP-dependent Clp protease, protease subunit
MWKNNALDEVQMGLISRNTISIGGDIDEKMAMYVREAFLRFIIKGSPPITLIITSPGGSVNLGLDICDGLRSYAGETTAIVYGYAESMAAVVLQACKKRIAMRHSHILVHHISTTQINLDILRDKRKINEVRKNLERDQKRLYKILTDRTGRSVEAIKEACSKDQFMSAEEALAFGLIDEIR